MADDQTTRFPDAASAWFWTMRVLLARQTGAPEPVGPCQPDDVIRCVDRLYRQHRIDMAHARVLRIWGERGTAPDATAPGDRRLWQHAIAALDWPLRTQGIVA